MGRQADKQVDRQTGRQADIQAGRQADIQTYRQIDSIDTGCFMPSQPQRVMIIRAKQNVFLPQVQILIHY